MTPKHPQPTDTPQNRLRQTTTATPGWKRAPGPRRPVTDRQQAVEHREGVEGQVDADGVEHPLAEEGVELVVDEAEFEPPQVPGQRGVVDAVAGDVRGEVGDQRVSQRQAEQGVEQENKGMAAARRRWVSMRVLYHWRDGLTSGSQRRFTFFVTCGKIAATPKLQQKLHSGEATCDPPIRLPGRPGLHLQLRGLRTTALGAVYRDGVEPRPRAARVGRARQPA